MFHRCSCHVLIPSYNVFLFMNFNINVYRHSFVDSVSTCLYTPVDRLGYLVGSLDRWYSEETGESQLRSVPSVLFSDISLVRSISLIIVTNSTLVHWATW